MYFAVVRIVLSNEIWYERRVRLHNKHCKIQAYNMHKFRLYRYLGHGRFVGGRGGSKRKRPNDVVGEKIDMFVAPYRLWNFIVEYRIVSVTAFSCGRDIFENAPRVDANLFENG